MGLVHVTIVTQATIMIDAAHQTCTQRRVGEHRVSVGCTAPLLPGRPMLARTYENSLLRKSNGSSRPPLDLVSQVVSHAEKVVSNIIQIEIHRCQAESTVDAGHRHSEQL